MALLNSPRKQRRTWLVSRRLESPGAVVQGKARRLVVKLNLRTGELWVRAEGCRRRKKYAVSDLWSVGQQLSLL